MLNPRGRLSAGGPAVGSLWQGDPARLHPTPQGLHHERPSSQTPHLHDPAGSAARGWVGLHGCQRLLVTFCSPPLISKGIQTPMWWHPPRLGPKEQAQNVKAGKLAGHSALNTHLQPQPPFLDNQCQTHPRQMRTRPGAHLIPGVPAPPVCAADPTSKCCAMANCLVIPFLWLPPDEEPPEGKDHISPSFLTTAQDLTQTTLPQRRARGAGASGKKPYA